jgi:hypothetical protein
MGLITMGNGHTKGLPNKRLCHVRPVPFLAPFIAGPFWAASFASIIESLPSPPLALDGISAPYGHYPRLLQCHLIMCRLDRISCPYKHYAAGERVTNLAREYGLSVARVSQIVNEKKYPMSMQKPNRCYALKI